MAGVYTTTFTDSNFYQDGLQDEVPVLVDFWAEWCGPCRMLGPTVDEVATESKGRVKVGKVDVDHNMGIAGRYQIRGVPTLLLFKEGKVVQQSVGAVPKSEIQRMLEAQLS